MAAMKKDEIGARLMAILRVNRPERLAARLAGLGLVDACGRCGGSGQYSFNQIHGSMCYGCRGAGKVARKLTPALLADAQALVDAGRLDAYLAELADSTRNRRRIAGAMDRIFAAWNANPTLAAEKARGVHWSRQSDRVCAINSFCAALVDEIKEEVANCEHGRWDAQKRRCVPVDAAYLARAVHRAARVEQLAATAEELLAAALPADLIGAETRSDADDPEERKNAYRTRTQYVRAFTETMLAALRSDAPAAEKNS